MSSTSRSGAFQGLSDSLWVAKVSSITEQEQTLIFPSRSTRQSYALQEFLRGEPSISERISGVDRGTDKGMKSKEYVKEAQDNVKKFDDNWKKSSAGGKWKKHFMPLNDSD